MLREHFLELARVLPEAMLLVAVGGRILAANLAAHRLLAALVPKLEEQSLLEIAAEPPAKIASYLHMCSRTRELLPGSIALRRGQDATVLFRVRGALLSPRSEATEPAVVLRLEAKEDAVSKFVFLNQKIDELTREVARRYLVEAALREVERERERLLQREQAARIAAEDARSDAEAANRAKDAFLSTLSHELRTPLNAIVGWLNILRTTPPDPARLARGITILERNAKAQVRLVDDMLDVSRIVSDTLQLNLDVVDLHAVLRAALEVILPSAEGKGVAIEVSLDPTATTVRGDADRLQQVAWNLLSNAVKFTPQGGRVQLVLTRGGPRIVLRVSDTGQGIHADFLPHVFERFRQADTSRTRMHSGLGLGLAIAKHLVQLHGGTIEAESEGPGRGATFTVALPVPAVELPREGLPLVHSEQAAPTPTLLEGARVLVVDDEPDARDLVATVLRGHGADVFAAASVDEALEILSRGRVDVVVSDIAMPGKDGYTLLEEARVIFAERERYLPAVALTAFTDPDEVQRIYRAGFQAHLAKPVAADQLIIAVARAAGRLRV